jgi:hypothetical protein
MIHCKDTWSGNTVRVSNNDDDVTHIVVTGPKGGHKFLIEIANADAVAIAHHILKHSQQSEV